MLVVKTVIIHALSCPIGNHNKKGVVLAKYALVEKRLVPSVTLRHQPSKASFAINITFLNTLSTLLDCISWLLSYLQKPRYLAETFRVVLQSIFHVYVLESSASPHSTLYLYFVQALSSSHLPTNTSLPSLDYKTNGHSIHVLSLKELARFDHRRCPELSGLMVNMSSILFTDHPLCQVMAEKAMHDLGYKSQLERSAFEKENRVNRTIENDMTKIRHKLLMVSKIEDRNRQHRREMVNGREARTKCSLISAVSLRGRQTNSGGRILTLLFLGASSCKFASSSDNLSGESTPSDRP